MTWRELELSIPLLYILQVLDPLVATAELLRDFRFDKIWSISVGDFECKARVGSMAASIDRIDNDLNSWVLKAI